MKIPLVLETLLDRAPLACALIDRIDQKVLRVSRWARYISDVAEMAPDPSIHQLGSIFGADTPMPSLQTVVEASEIPEWKGCIHGVAWVAVWQPVDRQHLLVHFVAVENDSVREPSLWQSKREMDDVWAQLDWQNQLYEAVEQLALVGYWTNAMGDDHVTWSKGLYNISGMEPGELLFESSVRELIHPNDLPRWLEARAACDGREVDVRWLHPGGQIRWMRTRMGRAKVKGGRQADFGVMQDITEQSDGLERLTRQLAVLRNVTSRIPVVVFQARVPKKGWGRFEFISESVYDIFSIKPEDLYVHAWDALHSIHPEDRQVVGRSMAESSANLKPWGMSFRVIHPIKGLRWCHAECRPMTQTDGSVLWHGYAQDVTSLRTAEEERAKQHQMLEAVSMAQGAFIDTHSIDPAVHILLNALIELTDSTCGVVHKVEQDANGHLRLMQNADKSCVFRKHLKRAGKCNSVDDGDCCFEEMFARILLKDASLRIGNLVDLNSSAVSEFIKSAGVGCFSLPLYINDRLVAVIGLSSSSSDYGDKLIESLRPLFDTLRQILHAEKVHESQQQAQQALRIATDRLRETEVDLKQTFESINQGLIKVNSGGHIHFYNKKYLELLNLPEELIASLPLHSDVAAFQVKRGDFGSNLELLDPSLHEYARLVSGVLPPNTYVRKTIDGRVIEVNSHVSPDGSVVRTYSDVTVYSQAQEALMEQKQRLSWVLEATRPGVWEVNLETGEMEINARWAQMLGYELEDLVPASAETWRKLVHPADLRVAEEQLSLHLNGHIPYYECDLRMRHIQGHWVWVNDRGRVHRRAPDGKALYMSGTHLDISERVAAQEQVRTLNESLEKRVTERTSELERSMRDMEIISYSIAHDLRAPLRTVNGFASLIQETELGRLSPEGQVLFERVARASAHMGKMITDMLELLRVVRVAYTPEVVKMNALASSVVELLAPSVPNAKIILNPMPEVIGDAKLLRQVILNLLDNALKYSKHKDDPCIEMGFDKQVSAFYVKDNGMGFSMDRAKKLFGLFQRLHSGATAPQGTGVGLAIVARTIERHGGTIWAESDTGKGATFWWTLPLPSHVEVP